MPEITLEVAAVLGKLEAGEALTVVEQLCLAELRRWTGIAKAPSVVELVKTELDGGVEKLVVFAYHREVIRIIAASLGSAAATIDGSTSSSERQRLIDAFQQRDTPRVLILQITAGGTAITLHRASRVIFAETTWVPADVVQAAKRCHRIGQRQSVLASIVSLSGSIDERVARVITRKAAEMTVLEDFIRKESAA
jgi:SWI/SNF-related matrix-associated actin-dependent regulator of chromatin subfamily A-like protein 1